MKIAFVSDAAFPWHMGGIEAVERVEAEELAKTNEVHFFSMRWPGMQREFTDGKIRYHTLGNTDKEHFYRHGRRSIRVAIKFALSMFNIFAAKYDVIECNMFPILHIPILRLYSKLFGCKLLLDVVEVWDDKYWLEYLKNGVLAKMAGLAASLFVKMADAYIANSSVTESRLIGLGIPKHKISVFAPILNDKETEPFRGKGNGSKTVVFWGRLIKEKRLDKWIGVMKATHQRMKSARGLIIGHGPEEAALKKMIHEEGLTKVVTIIPSIKERDKLWGRVSKCAVLLHMSEREGLGLVILESIALGIPVVLPAYTPVPDEVKAMCIVEDEYSIPDKLIEILKSRRRESFIRNRHNISEFEISKTRDFYQKLFSKLSL